MCYIVCCSSALRCLHRRCSRVAIEESGTLAPCQIFDGPLVSLGLAFGTHHVGIPDLAFMPLFPSLPCAEVFLVSWPSSSEEGESEANISCVVS